MNRCQKCHVVILDDTDRCPLCQHVLQTDGGKQENSYPNAIEVTRRFRFWENLFLFLSILVETLLIVINYSTNPKLPWSLVAGIVFLYLNTVLRMTLVGKSNLLFKILSLIMLAVMLLPGIDYLTGYRGWSLDYVLPSGILTLDAVLFVLILVNRRGWQSYMMAELITVLISVVPVIFRITGLIQFPYLVWLAFAASVFLFLGTLILGDRRARTELKRRFHI